MGGEAPDSGGKKNPGNVAERHGRGKNGIVF
jgi:hypothetical protein